MEIVVNQRGDSKVAVIESPDIVVSNVQEALDLMATVSYSQGCDKIVLHKSNLAEDFFELRTGLAGDVLQKYTNYHVKLAIVGEFDGYGSKSLKDFIYECNHGKQFFFLPNNEAALEALHGVK